MNAATQDTGHDFTTHRETRCTCNACWALLMQGLQLADEAMFAVLETETVAHDEYRTVLGLTNEDALEVPRLADASESLQQAVAWLRERGYVGLSEDPSGQYVDVMRRPGEEGDDGDG